MAATPIIRALRWRRSPGRPGFSARRRRITVFGTVHAPIFNPVVAAKEMVTADHIGEGRFGLNIVVGWNEGEFDMFGVEQRAHEDRYEYAQEWIDVIKLIWSDRENFDFDGKYLHMKAIKGSRNRLAAPARDHECRGLGDRPGLRGEELRRVLPAGLAHLARGNRDACAARQGRGGRAGPRDRLLHGRRRQLPADPEGGRGVFPSLHRRARRLERRRQHFWG